MEKEKELRDKCVEIYAKHREAIDTINRFISDIPSMRSKAFEDALRNNEELLDIKVGISSNQFTRFITNELDELTGTLGSNKWGKDNTRLLLYEITSNKTTKSLSIQLVLGPGEESSKDKRDRIINKFRESNFYNSKKLMKDKLYIWVKEMSIAHTNFEETTNEELVEKLIKYLSSNEFKKINTRIVEDIKEAIE